MTKQCPCGIPDCGFPRLEAEQRAVAEKQQREADNQQCRRYAEAALTGLCANGVLLDRFGLVAKDAAKSAFDFADAMLAEQKRRESAESAS